MEIGSAALFPEVSYKSPHDIDSELFKKVTRPGDILLPAIILSRIESSLFPPKAEKDVVFGELKIHPAINAVLDGICKFERGLLYRGLSLPLGGSLLGVARKEGG